MKTLALLLLLPMCAVADDMPNNIHQMTSSVPNAHYELVVSSWMRRETFRLDRYSGRIWQLVASGEGDKKSIVWEEMIVEGRTITPAIHPHFQIFLSGVWVADSYLIDTDSGYVWRLVEANEKEAEGSKYLIWEKMSEEFGLPISQTSKGTARKSPEK
jgi:hypothetical protein